MNILTNTTDFQSVIAEQSLISNGGGWDVDSQRGESEIVPSYLHHALFTFQQDLCLGHQQHSTELVYELANIDCTIANYFSDQIFERFPKIALVAYYREKGKVTIWTAMSELDRELRRKIYEVQEQTILRFPEYVFDCYVVSSVNVVPDSFTIIHNPNHQQ